MVGDWRSARRGTLRRRTHRPREDHSRPPGGPEPREQPPVDTVVAGHLPGQYHADRESKHDRVRGCRPGEQERHVHEGTEERREAGQDAKEEPEPDGDLAGDDERCEPGLVVPRQERVDEVAVPVVGDGRAALFGYRGRGLPAVSYTHLRAHETRHDLVCRLLLEK